MLSPALAYATGPAARARRAALTRAERAAFGRTARKTWRFFEELVGPADHWLIPDNYQENRRDLVAHRTSPTNIGLQLLSTLAAHDFGYLTLDRLLDRLEPTFDTLLRMQRYRGHFYNWYDTQTLAPLAPAYISTVDSGNLAGYLLTLRSGLIELTRASADHRRVGRWKASRIARELFERGAAPERPRGRDAGRLDAELQATCARQLATRPSTARRSGGAAGAASRDRLRVARCAAARDRGSR